MSARAVILSALGAVAAIAAAGAGYYFFLKNPKPGSSEKSGVDASAFEGEDAVDTLSVEAPPSDIPVTEGQETSDAFGSEGIEGDPWLDPEGLEGEPVEGSGDFVETEEPFEDVFAGPPDSRSRAPEMAEDRGDDAEPEADAAPTPP